MARNGKYQTHHKCLAVHSLSIGHVLILQCPNYVHQMIVERSGKRPVQQPAMCLPHLIIDGLMCTQEHPTSHRVLFGFNMDLTSLAFWCRSSPMSNAMSIAFASRRVSPSDEVSRSWLLKVCVRFTVGVEVSGVSELTKAHSQFVIFHVFLTHVSQITSPELG